MINNEGDESNDIFPSEKTVFINDDKILETFKPAPLLSSYNDMIRPLSDAVHTLLNFVIEVTTALVCPREYKGKSVPVNEDRILEEISLATDQIAGNGKDVSEVSLTLVVKNSSVPDLTIVDLPGIPVHDQSGNIYKKISEGSRRIGINPIFSSLITIALS
ncbi:putative dynamin-related protein 4A [Tanacetum coccineum]